MRPRQSYVFSSCECDLKVQARRAQKGFHCENKEAGLKERGVGGASPSEKLFEAPLYSFTLKLTMYLKPLSGSGGFLSLFQMHLCKSDRCEFSSDKEQEVASCRRRRRCGEKCSLPNWPRLPSPVSLHLLLPAEAYYSLTFCAAAWKLCAVVVTGS